MNGGIQNLTLDLRKCRVEVDRAVLNLRTPQEVYSHRYLGNQHLIFLRKAVASTLILLTICVQVRPAFASSEIIDSEVASPVVVDVNPVEEIEQVVENTLVEDVETSEPALSEEIALPADAEEDPEIQVEIFDAPLASVSDNSLITETTEVLASESFVSENREPVASASPEVLTSGGGSSDSTASSSEAAEDFTASLSFEFENISSESLPEVKTQNIEEEIELASQSDDISEEIPVDVDQLRADLESQLRVQIEQEMKNNCTNLDQIGYYCVGEHAKAVLSDKENQIHDVLAISAKPEGEQDSEIFLKDGEDAKRISDNEVDDLFPAISPSRKALVWQSFVQGHWEIFRYDMDKNSTERITFGKANNFNPQTDGSTIVWHGWADDNWEIFMARPVVGPASSSWGITKITANTQHDMFPRIAAGMIVWQSFTGDGWSIFSYDMASGNISQISNGDGKHENPRLTVVWDQQYGDGEKRVIGRDLATGKTLDLTPGRIPGVEKPFDLPVAPGQENAVALPGPAVSASSSRSDEQAPTVL